MRKVEIYLSEDEWVKKPTSDETKKYIAKPILNNRVELPLEDFASEIAEKSKVCMLGLFPKGTKTSSTYEFEGQQVLMLDIDNTNKNNEHFSYDEALEHDFVKNNVSFMYRTLSNKAKHVRFRMVIILKRSLLTKEEVTSVYLTLFNLLRNDFKGQLDEGMKNANRLFFGGKNGYEVINWSNTLDPDELMLDDSFFSSPLINTEKMDNKKSHILTGIGSIGKPTRLNPDVLTYNHSIPDNLTPVYDLLKQNKFSEVSTLINNKNINYSGVHFDSLEAFRSYITTDRNFSMRYLLDISRAYQFKDIFHVETTPSSNIYVSNTNDVELYTCHSSSAKFTGDIIDVISKLTKEGTVAAMVRLAEWLKIEIKEPLEVLEIRESVNWVKSELLSNDLKFKYPYAHKILWRYKQDLTILLDVYCSQDYRYNDIKERYEFISYMSRNRLNKEFENHFGKTVSLTTLHSTVNLMALTFMIRKLSFKDMPNDLRSKLIGYKKANNYERHTDVIVVTKFNGNFLNELNTFCKELYDTKFTKKSISKDYVVANYGMERAENTFAQTRPENKMVSNKFQAFLQDCIKILDRELEKSNYILEETLINRLLRNYKRQNKTTGKQDLVIQYRKIRNTLEDGYGFTIDRLNNSLREELSIKDTVIPKSKRPNIIRKLNI